MSSEEMERAISILGALFYLDGPQSPTLEFLQVLLRLEPEDNTVIFWDLHSIIHIPVSDQDPIRFYHASLWDFLMDRHRSRDLYIEGSKAHSFLLRGCIQTLADSYGGSTLERTAVALPYSGCWKIHYDFGDKLDCNGGFNPLSWIQLLFSLWYTFHLLYLLYDFTDIYDYITTFSHITDHVLRVVTCGERMLQSIFSYLNPTTANRT